MYALQKLALAVLALSTAARAGGMYSKNSPVLQVTAKSYDSLITKSNHTSIVEFYAPWCGHCQNLKPAFEKAAKSLAGLAKVAAVDCDEETNKPLCGQLGVQGFPTLKIVKPGTKPGRPVIEDYQGARSAKAIVDAVVDKIPNHVKRLQDAGLDTWLEDKSVVAKAILFSDKGTTGALIKALAVDFLGSIDFAQIRNKEKEAAEKFGITKFPTVVLIPAYGQDPVTYDGELKKEPLVKFFTQIAPPNPDPAPAKVKASASKKGKPANATASSKFAEASKAHKSSDYEEHMQGQGTTIVGEDVPTESPLPIVENGQKPLVVEEVAPALPYLQEASQLEAACLEPKSGNCILILLPKVDEGETMPESATKALSSFAEVADRHKKRQANIFPFYGIPDTNKASEVLRKSFGLKGDDTLEIIAINRKRKWWRSYSATDYEIANADDFVDAIKLGEGTKTKLSPDFYASESASEATSEPVEAATEPSSHDEL